MKEQKNLRRGLAAGVAAFTGLSAAALGVVGISEQADFVAERDVTLVSAADAAHQDLIAAQVGLDHSQFHNDAALQQGAYSWALEPVGNGGLGLPDDSLLFPGDTDDPAGSPFTGAFSGFTQANLVGQVLAQAQLDDVPGVNQTVDVGGYAGFIGAQVYDDLSGAGISPDSDFGADLANLIDSDVQAGAGGFQDALMGLQGDLVQAAWADVFGMFGIADVAP